MAPDRMETHLSELMRATYDDPGPAAQLEDMAPGLEGRIEVISISLHPVP
jgi:hypothetical protein